MTEFALGKTLTDPKAIVFIARDQLHRTQGFCMGQAENSDYEPDLIEAYLRYIAVAPEYRGSGLATKLYWLVIDELKRIGVTCLNVWANSTSGATKFFAKQGLVRGKEYTWMDMRF